MLPAPDAFRGTARFQLLQLLGQGGMGVVYEAFDRERNGRVALKTIRTLTPDNLLRFKNEFRTLQDLQHPNLVRLDELFEADGTWFFTMEIVDGTDFLRHVRPGLDAELTPQPRTGTGTSTGPTVGSDEPPPVEATAVLGATMAIREQPTQPTQPTGAGPRFDEGRLRRALPQLVRGLTALHAAGKIHRDVKPANVRVGRDERVVLLDFGLVTDAFPRELEGKAVGTVTYMAPEQISDEVVGPAADWYSLGVTLYMALTGRPPFMGNPVEVASLKRLVNPVPPAKVVPGVPPDLDALCMSLLARDPARRPDGVQILRRLGARAPSPAAPRGRLFIGRERELAQLRDAFGDVVAGGSAAVLVHGESGVGKSALVRTFLEGVAGPATTVLGGRCYERESVPYKALDQVVDALGRHLASLPADEVEALLPERIGLVAEVFPALRKVAAIEASGEARTANPFQSRAAVFAAMRELWTRLGRRAPLVIGIDDLQWADLDSLGLLAHVFEPPAPPLLLCATVRTETGHDLAALHARLGGDVRDIRVEPLPPVAARALAGALLGAEPGDAIDARAAAIADEAGGHPMFIEALVHDRSGHAGARLDDVLVARATALDAAAVPVLDLICLAGGPIPQDACGQAAAVPFDELVRLIAVLRVARLVRTRGPRRGDTVEPYHDRVREAMVARLSPEARRGLHQRLAIALEATHGADAELLATHFAGAGETQRAARYAVRAADRAHEVLAFAQAARLYRMALALDPGAAARLRIALAGALANAGHGREAGEEYLAAAEVAPPAEQNELRRLAAEQLLISGRIDEGVAVLRTVLDAMDLSMPATPRAALASLLRRRLQVRMRRDVFRPRFRDAADIPAETLARIDTCYSAAMGLATVDTIRGADFQSRHILLALDAGEPYRIARALAAEASFSAARGSKAARRTERLLTAAEALAVQTGNPNALGFANFAIGTAEYLAGRWSSGLVRCDLAATIFRERCTGVAWWMDTVQYFGLECLAYGGHLGELARRVPALLADAEARGDQYAATNLRVGIPNLGWLVADDVDGARANIAGAMAGWSQAGFHIQHLAEVLARVQVELYAGDGGAAHHCITAAWPAITGAVLSRVQLTRVMTFHQRARAALAAAGERRVDRRRLIAEALGCARRIAAEHLHWGDPMAALARAGAAHLSGDLAQAATELDLAIRGFDAADMGGYAAAARYRRGEVTGGDAGAALIAEAVAALEAQSVRRADRLVATLAPGF